MRKILTFLLLAVFLSGIVPGLAGAQTTSVDTQQLLEKIQTLLKQIQDLQAKINELRTQQQQATTDVSGLLSELKQGDTGDKVKALQALLAADSDVYPEALITGYYGRLTSGAVQRFQKKNGISTVGFVGPQTLKKLKEVFQANPVALESTATGTRPCAIVPPGHLIAPGWLRKQGGAAPVVPACQVLPPGIAAKLGMATSTPTSTPDTVAPVISGVSAQNISADTATIVWSTNELSDSKAYYGTSTPLNLASSSSASNSSFVLTHSLSLSGLSTSTTYYYVVESKDASGNVATSSQQSFTTTAQVDTTAPVISLISVAGVTTSTATLIWTTDELATSKAYYGISTPLVTSTAAFVFSPAFVTSHSLSLSGLNASTTYYFVLESADASANVSVSTEQSFLTP